MSKVNETAKDNLFIFVFLKESLDKHSIEQLLIPKC